VKDFDGDLMRRSLRMAREEADEEGAARRKARFEASIAKMETDPAERARIDSIAAAVGIADKADNSGPVAPRKVPTSGLARIMKHGLRRPCWTPKQRKLATRVGDFPTWLGGGGDTGLLAQMPEERARFGQSATTKVPAPAGTTKQKLGKRGRRLGQLLAIVIAAVIGLAGVVTAQLLSQGQPPSASVVTVLMAEEAAAAVAHRPADAIRLYVSTAFVRDAACLTLSQSHTWYGRDQILQRYQQLGAFSWLKHLNAEVSFTPDNAQATSATATAQTAGFIEPSPTSPTGQYIHGNEVWTFIRVNGKWLISSFIYNVCLAPG